MSGTSARKAGVVLPLFSIRTRDDWGIGSIPALVHTGRWAHAQGLRLLQILPPYELAQGETSPYGARTAFGLDPIYVDVRAECPRDVTPEDEREGARLHDASHVPYDAVRALKARVLGRAFERFLAEDHGKGTPRDLAFRAFREAESAWLADLALYVAVREANGGHGWTAWPAELRDRAPAALDAARSAHARRVLEHEHAQWLAHVQWDAARSELAALGVALMGDLPFIVGCESADVWAHQDWFRRDVSLGAPPDAFSPEDGQDWGLPAYDWARMDATGLAWIRARTRHAARLYDSFRLDHVVGYFRQWVRPHGQRGHFDPGDEHAQRARGELVLRAILEAAGGAQVVAEDLGVIPPFVRETLWRLEVPGYRVLPWERDHDHRLRDPRGFPAKSVATWSTHDTAPITQWWDDMQPYEREDFTRLARENGVGGEGAPTRLELLDLLFRAASDLALVQAQELIGARDRINVPATVTEANWSWRLPSDVDGLRPDPEIARMLARSGR